MEQPFQKQKRRRIHLSLHVAILALFLAIFLAAGGFLTWFSFRSQSELAEQSAVQRLHDITDKILERQDRFFEPAFALANIGLHQVSRSTDAIEGREDVVRRIDAIAFYPQLYSAYFGMESGEFFQVLSYGGVPPEMRQKMDIPSSAAFAVRHVIPGKGLALSETWLFLDAQKREILLRKTPRPSYDPRTRPWYIEARKRETAVVSRPYIFESTHQPGLTVSRRLQGGRDGVVGVDVDLAQFTTFLQANRVGKDGFTMLIDGSGHVIASKVGGSGADNSTDPGHVLVDTILLKDLKAPVLTALAERLPDKPVGDLRLTAGGKPYIARISRLPEQYGDGVLLAVVASLNQFTDPISGIRDRALLISLGILIAAIPLIWWVARQISRPMKLLVRETQRIRNLELTESHAVRSIVSEINDLGVSFEGMKGALETFTKYVPRALVLDFLKNHLQPTPGGDARSLTVFFTDVKDFTMMSEGMPPADLLLKTTTYFKELGTVILENEGTIDKFIGDSIMAFWNAPTHDPNHVARAARTMLLCRAQSADLNRRWESYGWPIMYTRFGLHTGDAIVGNVGSSDRLNYTALGDTVNLASRLEGLNKYYGTQLLVSEAVQILTRGEFVYRPVDVVQPKGTSRPVRIYELIGANAGEKTIVATDAQCEMAADWSAIHERYLARDWDGTMKAIRPFAKRNPQDKVCRILFHRCRQFAATPPPANWTGAEVFTQK